MSQVNSSFIERYQLIYQKDPNSKVFAPLAEAYRKMGWLKEALELAQEGVSKHPQFAGGLVALGQVRIDLGQMEEAAKSLKKATEIAPENIRAYELLGQCHLKLKQPKEALQAYKMLLFFSPNHTKAEQAVKKLESLTADEYEDEVFEMTPLEKETLDPKVEEIQNSSSSMQEATSGFSELERYISLADAYIVRNDISGAQLTLQKAEMALGPQKPILKRMQILQNRLDSDENGAVQKQHRPRILKTDIVKEEKIIYLQKLLQRVSDRQHSSEPELRS